jgi:hypothetical protein
MLPERVIHKEDLLKGKAAKSAEERDESCQSGAE